MARQASRTAIRFTWYGTASHSGCRSFSSAITMAAMCCQNRRDTRLQDLNRRYRP